MLFITNQFIGCNVLVFIPYKLIVTEYHHQSLTNSLVGKNNFSAHTNSLLQNITINRLTIHWLLSIIINHLQIHCCNALLNITYHFIGRTIIPLLQNHCFNVLLFSICKFMVANYYNSSLTNSLVVKIYYSPLANYSPLTNVLLQSIIIRHLKFIVANYCYSSLTNSLVAMY